MSEAPPGLSTEDLQALARLETVLEDRVLRLAVEIGRSVDSGGGITGDGLARIRDALADLQASRAVSDLAARRSPDWQLREDVATQLRRERADAQHRLWLAQIQQADHGTDRLGDLVRVVAKIAADIVMVVDRTPPSEADVDARFARALGERKPGG